MIVSLRYSLYYFIDINSITIYLSVYRSPTLVNTLNWYTNLRDTIREAWKRCDTISHGIYIYYFIIFMLSETLLFMVLLWVIFHFILSSYYILIESIFIPEPYELAYGTTLLLSSAGISIGSVLITRDYLGIYYWNTISSLIYSILFILIQTNEFNYLGYYMNDSELGCIYIYISGLHFIHVLYGIITLGASSNSISILLILILPIYTVPMDMYYIMDYYYWHIVEIVYIYIYITLYYYYRLRP